MICPYCLQDTDFKRELAGDSRVSYFACDKCSQPIPKMYVTEYSSCPPVIMNAIGFAGHGKTVFFSSLLHTLRLSAVSSYWPDFYTLGLDDNGIGRIHDNIEELEKGRLPESTRACFNDPTLMRLYRIPVFGSHTLLLYDTGGESFTQAGKLIRHAHFVKRANTAMFLVSLSEMLNPAVEMQRLLNTFIVGMRELDAATQDQHIVIVLTKADRFVSRLDGYDELNAYIHDGKLDSIGNLDKYISDMKHISLNLRNFVLEKLGAQEFINTLDDNFKSVEFSMVSATGAEPDSQRLTARLDPRRIFDPLFWMIEKSRTRIFSGFRLR